MKFFDKFFNGVSKKESISWAFYDFANSAYGMVILTILFPPFFKEVLAGVKLGDFYWGLVFGISILSVGLVSPVLGAIADYSGNRKKIFVWLSLLTIIGIGALYFSDLIPLLFASLLFAITNFFYGCTFAFYDSFLVRIANKKIVGRISGLGWGLGYAGGLIAMVLVYPLFVNGFEGINLFSYKLSFPIGALFFLIFAVPSFIFIKEGNYIKKVRGLFHSISMGIKNVFRTIKEIKSYKNIFLFLVGFYFITDGIYTLTAFITIYGRDIFSLPMKEVFIIFLILQAICFPATLFAGLLSDKKGSKKILLISVVGWIAIILLLTFTPAIKFMFYLLAVLTGLVLGSSQSLARSWLSKMVPEEKRCEFFGFNSLSSKVSATFGPIIFGAIASFTGNMRLAMFSVAPWFLAGFIVLLFIKEPK